jgi:hypothetical protein
MVVGDTPPSFLIFLPRSVTDERLTAESRLSPARDSSAGISVTIGPTVGNPLAVDSDEILEWVKLFSDDVYDERLL